MTLLYLSAVAAILSLIFAFIASRRVLREDTGTDAMRAISALIQSGAAAFLKREYTFLVGFVAVVAIRRSRWQNRVLASADDPDRGE